MTLHIRRARPTDAAVAVPLIIEAIGEIAEQMTGETSPASVEQELVALFRREDNRHSYLHTVVAERQESVVAVMVLYSGIDALTLDENLIQWLYKKSGQLTSIPPEARIDEYYIDTICVHPDFRGQATGSLLLSHADQVARDAGFSKVVLNVEPQKEAAIRLYKRMGYQVSGPWVIYGGTFYHMSKELT
ncbi:GNAT family N-acetyltransferase [Paenisporosarcina sp. TG20]|uniref:GNAT family N-acetyltransferase n=1 Tax=Paenisporosarcina sp. TG20 TaxID=1211706 RepID=UPI00030099A6|nr:GNAT family N-acetyltransferase [Paenisporosarcina sp. TG20]